MTGWRRRHGESRAASWRPGGRWVPCVLLGSWLLAGLGAASAQPSAKNLSAPPAPAQLQLPPVVPAPGPGTLIVSCDPGGCWDEYGVRYDRADAGVFIHRDGRSCLATKGRMRCE